MTSIEDIRREHEQALAGLTPEQRRALGRLREACQQTNFNGRSPKENLLALFRREALARSEASPPQKHQQAA